MPNLSIAFVVPAAPATLSIDKPTPVPLAPCVAPGSLMPLPTSKLTFSSVVIFATKAFAIAVLLV